MDLNNIVLPATVIADLYTTTLVEANTALPSVIKAAVKESFNTEPAKSESTFKFLGNNRKKILVVVNDPDAVFVTDNDLQFLTGVLSACKLSLDDIAVFNRFHHSSDTYQSLLSFFNSRIVWLMDIEPAAFGLPMSFPHYQVQPFAGNSFLFAPSLKTLQADKGEKMKLWTALKRLFNL